jgi:Tol biopolymer transport system component
LGVFFSSLSLSLSLLFLFSVSFCVGQQVRYRLVIYGCHLNGRPAFNEKDYWHGRVLDDVLSVDYNSLSISIFLLVSVRTGGIG